MQYTKNEFKNAYRQRFMSLLSKSLEDGTTVDKYVVLATMVREAMSPNWVLTNDYYLKNGEKQIYYLSLEFLVGKSLETNLQYMGREDLVRDALEELGIDFDELIECEPDAALGNGGLGQLAACFLDSLASMGYPGHGCGIRYKYGLFKQQIVDGYQVELPDNWLRTSNPWEIRKPDKAVIVRFNGDVRSETDMEGNPQFIHENYEPVMAVPYDMPVIGRLNNTVNTLRLWSAESVGDSFDFASFSRGDYTNAISGKYSVEAISEVLYPDDSNYSNRLLRLKQQYFFVSAGIQSIIRRFRKKHHNLKLLPDLVCIHINDTHPALAIPELMRILIDTEGFGGDEAWDMTTKIIAYTNHTIMPEALETWPVDLFQELLPRIYMIVEEINRRFCLQLEKLYPDDPEKIHRLSIIADGVVRMANLAVVGSFSVNGVAKVHSDLLKNVVLKDLYDVFPKKFNNKTNGITHRRWLMKSNPELADFVTDSIGENWQASPTELHKIENQYSDNDALLRLEEIKLENKLHLAQYIKNNNDITVDPHSIFDVQVKRIHAYKRQLLNALHIQYLYNLIKSKPDLDMVPRTFIFAGKAAPSYYFAKRIIKYINALGDVVNRDPQVNDRLKVVFLENYNVGLAELIFPASEVSEQISTASKEASGTGNMKFMMNGAITVGTNDGANIEIAQLVGLDNFFLFGLGVEEVLGFYNNGGYSARETCQNDPRIKEVIDQLSGTSFFPHVPREDLDTIVQMLIDYNDEYFVLKDFSEYAAAHQKIDALYRDRESWNKMSLVNIAMSGYFSSDNTIEQYADEIWHVGKCNPGHLL